MEREKQAPSSFSEITARYIARSGYNVCQVGRLAGLPRTTLVNWLEGQVKKPRLWQDVVKLARALRLNRVEADELLHVAGHPSLSRLQVQAQGKEEQDLLSVWVPGVAGVEERTSAQPQPFQAIPDLPTFVGREALLQTLQASLLPDYHDVPTVLEGVVGGGKTVLAARLAYRLRDHFPDGVLWARMDITNAMSTLRRFAEAYGRDVSDYKDEGSRSAAVRELLAGKRALVVLDNVSDNAEIEPLLPPSGPCAVLITTRRRNLPIAHGAPRFHVEPFSQEEVLALFAKVLGKEVVARDRIALLELSELLGHLPLAVDIVACRLAYEPGWSVATLLTKLRRERTQLNGLAYAERSMRLALESTFAALLPEQQKLFAVLGTFDGMDFSVEAAAAVAGLPVVETDFHLRELFCLSLVRRGRPGHYRLIPILKSFALAKAVTLEKE